MAYFTSELGANNCHDKLVFKHSGSFSSGNSQREINGRNRKRIWNLTYMVSIRRRRRGKLEHDS